MEGMSGVRTALKTCNHRISACKHINDFSFSFVAPLEAEYNIKVHCWYIVILFIIGMLEWKVILRAILCDSLRLCRHRLRISLWLRLV